MNLLELPANLSQTEQQIMATGILTAAAAIVARRNYLERLLQLCNTPCSKFIS